MQRDAILDATKCQAKIRDGGKFKILSVVLSVIPWLWLYVCTSASTKCRQVCDVFITVMWIRVLCKKQNLKTWRL